MFALRRALTCISLLTVCVAADVSTILQHTEPVSHIKGEVLAPNGDPILGVDIVVLSPPETQLEKSLTPLEKRERQQKVAAAVSDEDGRFVLKRLGKGDYELEFSKGGFSTLYVLVRGDSSARAEKFCVELSVSDGNGKPSFRPCTERAKRSRRGSARE